MTSRYSSLLLMALAVVTLFSVNTCCNAFVARTTNRRTATVSSSSLSMAVVDIDGEAAFDKTIKNAGDSLVVVDYSTTW